MGGHVLTKDCHSHAVRESRAKLESDCRRISPGNGDSTSPSLPPVLAHTNYQCFGVMQHAEIVAYPGKAVPRS